MPELKNSEDYISSLCHVLGIDYDPLMNEIVVTLKKGSPVEVKISKWVGEKYDKPKMTSK